jgi:hypothetical protein
VNREIVAIGQLNVYFNCTQQGESKWGASAEGDELLKSTALIGGCKLIFASLTIETEV